jgi:flagellar hook-length control protein FliK
MQTHILPQVSGASAAPRANANANASGDGAQFSQALSREMEQRQPGPAAPAAAPAKQHASEARSQAAPPAQNAHTAQADGQPAPAKGADGKRVAAPGNAGKDEASDDAADAAAVTPVTDMLALVASFNQPVAVAAAPAIDPLAAAAAAAALKAAEPVDFSLRPVQADADATELADAIKGQPLPAAPPAADDKTLTFKEVAKAFDGAARMPAHAPSADPITVDIAMPRVAAPADDTALADKGSASLKALASAAVPAVETDGDAAPVVPKAEPSLAPVMVKVEAAPPRAREGAADIAAVKEPAASAPVSAPVAQASLVMSQAVHASPAERIAARVGTPAWDNQVGQKIVWMVAGKEQSATLTLNPPDMGPMQVVLSVTNDQATVSFTAAQPEVRQALENAMPKLREMMSENGIALGNASVNEGAPDQRQAQHGEKSRGQGNGNRFGNGGDVAGAVEAPRAARSSGSGLVDTFA